MIWTGRIASALKRLERNLETSFDLGHVLCKMRPNLTDVTPFAPTQAAVRLNGKWLLLGAVPAPAQLEALVHWLHLSRRQGSPCRYDDLAEVYAPAAKFANTAKCVLSVSLGNAPRDQLLWFRRSASWRPSELEAAHVVQRLITKAVLARSLVAERDLRDAVEEERVKLRLVAGASDVLLGSMQFDECLQSVARYLTTAFCEACIVYRKDERGGWQRAALRHRTSQGQRVLDRLPTVGEDEVVGSIASKLHSLGGSMLRSWVTDDWLAGVWPSQAYRLHLRDTLGVHSFLCVEVTSRHRLLGLMMFLRSDTHERFDERDEVTAKDLARRAAEAAENILRYESAQEAAQTREQVLQVVSHDLRGPVTAITLTTDNIERRLRKSEDVAKASLSAGLERIRASSRRMLALLEDLLGSAKLANGSFELQQEMVPTEHIVRDAIALAEPVAAAKGVAIVVDNAYAPAEVLCDRNRIAQVFINLLGNAIKFTPKHGTVTMKVASVDAGWVKFLVSDTGPGIAVDDLPHVFDRFWQAKKTANQGTGLGLFIAHSIVQAHRGKIAVSTEQSEGVTFSVSLPQKGDDVPARLT